VRARDLKLVLRCADYRRTTEDAESTVGFDPVPPRAVAKTPNRFFTELDKPM
jgi:hypothetical protein